MSFPQLRETFDQDSEELALFSQVLQRELTQAADQLRSALANGDVTTVGDLKHKLKTSLQILDAHQVTTQLADACNRLKKGEAIPVRQQQQVVKEIEELVVRLRREKW